MSTTAVDAAGWAGRGNREFAVADKKMDFMQSLTCLVESRATREDSHAEPGFSQ